MDIHFCSQEADNDLYVSVSEMLGNYIINHVEADLSCPVR